MQARFCECWCSRLHRTVVAGACASPHWLLPYKQLLRLRLSTPLYFCMLCCKFWIHSARLTLHPNLCRSLAQVNTPQPPKRTA